MCARGSVYERVPHITLRDIANNAEIDVIYEEYQREMGAHPLRTEWRPGNRVGGVGDTAGRR